MYFSTVYEWLEHIASLNAHEIDLSLERVKAIAERLTLLPVSSTVIVVGGTNGKGSTVAGLESIYLAAGYQVGAFTSPILFKHNEYVRINGHEAIDADFCAAYEKIETAREEIPLTPFEFHTLAALLIFKSYSLPVLILEVGLGGRFDAVNIVDSDLAIVTSIGIDHVEYLGNTREAIAFEKAGIFRSGKAAICGDFDPPRTLLDQANKLEIALYCQGKHFYYHEDGQTNWSWAFQTNCIENLPKNALALQNMAIVLTAISLLQEKLPLKLDAIVTGLAAVKLPGRIQVMDSPVKEIFDVAHNPAAILFLANQLQTLPCAGKTYAVFSMLADKDILQSLKSIRQEVTGWYVAPLNVKRAASLEQLSKAFAAADISSVTFSDSISKAYESAKQIAEVGDRIIIFGSFHTVAEVWKFREAAIS